MFISAIQFNLSNRKIGTELFLSNQNTNTHTQAQTHKHTNTQTHKHTLYQSDITVLNTKKLSNNIILVEVQLT